jgi:hypothetical protein
MSKRQILAAALLAACMAQALADGYAAVWRPGAGTQWVKAGVSADEFKTADLDYFKQGLRIVSLTVRDGKLTAVWQPGTGTQWVHWDMGEADFKAKDSAYFKQGLRIASFALHNGRFAAVWRPGTGAQWVHWACRAISSRPRTRLISRPACASRRSSWTTANSPRCGGRARARSGCTGA